MCSDWNPEGIFIPFRCGPEIGKDVGDRALLHWHNPFLRRLRKLHCPIVTAVNGPAAGEKACPV